MTGVTGLRVSPRPPLEKSAAHAARTSRAQARPMYFPKLSASGMDTLRAYEFRIGYSVSMKKTKNDPRKEELKLSRRILKKLGNVENMIEIMAREIKRLSDRSK